MAFLRIPPVITDGAVCGSATALVRLVGDVGGVVGPRQVIGFDALNLTTSYRRQRIPASGLTLVLAATEEIARANGGVTWYEVTITAPRTTETLYVQLALTDAPQELRSLVGAALMDPAAILNLASHIATPHLPADAVEGQAAIFDGDGAWVGTTIFAGLSGIAVVDEEPAEQLPGILYCIKE